MSGGRHLPTRGDWMTERRYCLDIRKDVHTILESIDGMLVIDTDERIVFMCKKLMNMVGVESFAQIRGKKLREVIASNLTWRVLKTGERQIGVTYLVQGYTVVSNSYPIYRGGKLIGALEYDVFEDADLLLGFLNKMSSQKGLERFGAAVNMRKREKYTLESIKGSSQVMKDIKNEIKLASRSNSTVLITGETGTGKELIAQAIHMAGNRSLFEFVEVNCSTIPPELFESELFGYEEGSFTGARKGGKKGLVHLADKGTLFLDEVGTLPLLMQAKILRFLQEREVRAVGAERSVSLDVRVICATNVNLRELVAAGDFREDLFYRLNVIQIESEPLRNRRSDIPELVNHFIEQLNVSLERTLVSDRIRSIDNDALLMLMDYHWPGNVRELHNALERAINHCTGNVLTLKHFVGFPERPLAGLDSAQSRDGGEGGSTEAAVGDAEGMVRRGDGLDYDLTLRELRTEVEVRAINRLISEKGMSVSAAARQLGITRQMLHKKLRDYAPRIG